MREQAGKGEGMLGRWKAHVCNPPRRGCQVSWTSGGGGPSALVSELSLLGFRLLYGWQPLLGPLPCGRASGSQEQVSFVFLPPRGKTSSSPTTSKQEKFPLCGLNWET